MRTHYNLNKHEDSRKMARLILQKFPQSRYVWDVYTCLGDLFVEEGNFPAALRMYVLSRKLDVDETISKRIDHRIIKTLKMNIPFPEIEELLSVEYDPIIRSILFFGQVSGAIFSGQPDQAASILSEIHIDHIPETYFDLYEELLLSSYHPPRKTSTLGVVLPLSGAYRVKGNSFLTGLIAGIQSRQDETNNFSLVVYDNRSNGIETIQAVKKIAGRSDILAIIGPLVSENALLAANTLSGTKLPVLIPSSKQNGLAEIGENIFQLNSDEETRGRLAARYAVESLELKNVAVLAPSNEMGHNLVDSFCRELDILGQPPVAIEWYFDIPEDLNAQFSSIRETAWELMPKQNEDEEFLGLQIDSLDALFQVSVEDFFDLPVDTEKELSARDSSKIFLDTIDGIYMPVPSNHLSFLATQFPMYNLKTQVIGNEPWQNLEILNQENVGPHLNGMIVISSRRYSEENKNLQDSYYSQGFDCYQLLSAVSLEENLDRKTILEKLNSMVEFHGKEHIYSFAGNQPNLNKTLQILQYNEYKYSPAGYFTGDSTFTSFTQAP